MIGNLLTSDMKGGNMDLGAFSVSLTVKDLEASMSFYAKLGFEPVAGDPKEHRVIMRNGDHVIGLFQGMFERNVLTFNPGWDQQCSNLDEFTDVRELQRELRKRGIPLADAADESSTGPAYCMIFDPDGNPILLDQHR